MIKFSKWIKLREESAAPAAAPSSAAPAAAPSTSTSTSTSTSDTPPSESGGTSSKDIAIRPSVLGCGFCYPSCSCNCNKKKKKKKRKK